MRIDPSGYDVASVFVDVCFCMNFADLKNSKNY